jgi:hypothetical protein
MICTTTGRERTAAEHAELLAAAGWHYDATYRAPNGPIGVVAATAA